MSSDPGDPRAALDALLATDPNDLGCELAMELLHAYAELLAAGRSAYAHAAYPQVAAHVRACGPCQQDLEGLLAALDPLG